MSSEVNFTLDYTPKFIKQPIVWEKKASPLSNVRHRQLPREKRGIFKVCSVEMFVMMLCYSIVFRELQQRRELPQNHFLPSKQYGILHI